MVMMTTTSYCKPSDIGADATLEHCIIASSVLDQYIGYPAAYGRLGTYQYIAAGHLAYANADGTLRFNLGRPTIWNRIEHWRSGQMVASIDTPLDRAQARPSSRYVNLPEDWYPVGNIRMEGFYVPDERDRWLLTGLQHTVPEGCMYLPVFNVEAGKYYSGFNNAIEVSGVDIVGPPGWLLPIPFALKRAAIIIGRRLLWVEVDQTGAQRRPFTTLLDDVAELVAPFRNNAVLPTVV